jgi:hypothetical protein
MGIEKSTFSNIKQYGYVMYVSTCRWSISIHIHTHMCKYIIPHHPHHLWGHWFQIPLTDIKRHECSSPVCEVIWLQIMYALCTTSSVQM